MFTLVLLACAHSPEPLASDYWSDLDVARAVRDADAALQHKEAALSHAHDLGREARKRCAEDWEGVCGPLEQQSTRVAARKRVWEDASTDYLRMATAPSVSRKKLRELQLHAETAQHAYEAEVLRLVAPAEAVLRSSAVLVEAGGAVDDWSPPTLEEEAPATVSTWSVSMH